MIGHLFKILGLIAFWELVLRVVFKTSLSFKTPKSLYMYLLGAILFALVVIFVKQDLAVPQTIFAYASIFYAIGISGCDVVTHERIKNKKIQIIINILFIIVLCAITYLPLPYILPLI